MEATMPENIFSEPRNAHIPSSWMAKARVVSLEPENEVISYLEGWLLEQNIDPQGCRKFGFDVMISDQERSEGKRGYEYWAEVPETLQGTDTVAVERFEGGEYISLRITDPFANPFDRIPRGWQTLVRYVRDGHFAADWCTPGSCLEEVVQTDEGVCMDIFIRLRLK